MAAKRMDLIGLTVLALATTSAAALAQSFTLPEEPELAVSPALPSGLLSGESTGSNQLTGLPCSGAARRP
jgi:hypothetical protein